MPRVFEFQTISEPTTLQDTIVELFFRPIRARISERNLVTIFGSASMPVLRLTRHNCLPDLGVPGCQLETSLAEKSIKDVSRGPCCYCLVQNNDIIQVTYDLVHVDPTRRRCDIKKRPMQANVPNGPLFGGIPGIAWNCVAVVGSANTCHSNNIMPIVRATGGFFFSFLKKKILVYCPVRISPFVGHWPPGDSECSACIQYCRGDEWCVTRDAGPVFATTQDQLDASPLMLSMADWGW